MCSCRGSDCQRTQNMHRTKDALTGQSRMKNHRKWVQWAVPLTGLSGIDWITPWIKALNKAGLPGCDFLTLGLAKGGAEWSKSPAEYNDLEMMYHFILMNEIGMPAKEAATFSIHGLKHFLITAATQLNIDRDVINQFGHWHAGLKMADKYNQTKCVQELQCRTAIQKQFLNGWRPVGGSELANEWIEHENKFDDAAEKLNKNVISPFAVSLNRRSCVQKLFVVASHSS